MKSPPPHEHVCLITGGGYPYRRDALSGWCRTLVEGLRRVRFDLLCVTDREPQAAPAYPLPLNVGSTRAVQISRDLGRERRAVQISRDLGRERRRGETNDAGNAAAQLLCRGLLGADQFAAGLRALAELATERPDPLAQVPVAELLSDAWRACRPDDHDPPLPRLSTRDAKTAATLLRHALDALSVELPRTGLVHCVGGTTPLLTALAGHWRTDVPLLLTEARAPVARHKPHEDRLSPAVRMVLRRFRAEVARVGYAEASLIAPVSAYHHGWALQHGADVARLVQVPAGVDPSDFPGAAERETGPTVVWAGSGGPDSGLAPLLAAFEQVAAAEPGTVLHLVGVTPAHEDHCAVQIERTGLGRAIRLHPLPADPRDRYTLGHVVAHVPGPADPPYRLIEAMMSGRAVVGVDVGPAAETLGDTGVLVQPDDPAELAIAIVGLLRSPGQRRLLGEAARRRALLHFTTDRVVRAYGALYTDLAGPPPPAEFPLALAVPAPRSAPPATMRWLAMADNDQPDNPTTAAGGPTSSTDAPPTPSGTPIPTASNPAAAPTPTASKPAGIGPVEAAGEPATATTETPATTDEPATIPAMATPIVGRPAAMRDEPTSVVGATGTSSAARAGEGR